MTDLSIQVGRWAEHDKDSWLHSHGEVEELAHLEERIRTGLEFLSALRRLREGHIAAVKQHSQVPPGEWRDITAVLQSWYGPIPDILAWSSFWEAKGYDVVGHRALLDAVAWYRREIFDPAAAVQGALEMDEGKTGRRVV